MLGVWNVEHGYMPRHIQGSTSTDLKVDVKHDTCRGMSRAAQPQESLEVDVEQDTGHSTVGEDWQSIAVEEQGLMNIPRKAQTGRAE